MAEHVWIPGPSAAGWECCQSCHVVKRADGQNGPCRGKVRIGPRTPQRTAELLKRSTPEQRQAAREADAAQDAQDRANGAALRRLQQESGSATLRWARGWRVTRVLGDGVFEGSGDTLPEAVDAALAGEQS